MDSDSSKCDGEVLPLLPILLVAIDIAKVRNEVLIEAPNHKRRRRYPFSTRVPSTTA